MLSRLYSPLTAPAPGPFCHVPGELLSPGERPQAAQNFLLARRFHLVSFSPGLRIPCLCVPDGFLLSDSPESLTSVE